MIYPYGQYPELTPSEASCLNCAKGRNGKDCCPVSGKVAKCGAYQRLRESDKPAPPEQARFPSSFSSASMLVPTLVSPDIVELADQILRVWNINTGKGIFSQYSIINRRNPALAPLYDRFQARVKELGAYLPEDMIYILWSLRMLSGGARKEYAKYCERVELSYEIKKGKTEHSDSDPTA